jgi:threonine/homoserine/homoserine lactone efflux protein
VIHGLIGCTCSTYLWRNASAVVIIRNMLSGILQGLILGFILTAIPGAVVLEATHRALARKPVLSFLAGNFVGVGVTVAITMVGLSSVLGNSSWSHVSYLLSGLTLLYIGLASIASKKLVKRAPALKRGDDKTASQYKALITGLILATANPVSILFWITMIGRYLNNHESYAQIISNSTAIVVGGAVFFGVLLTVIGITHKLMSQKYVVILNDAFGIVILIYGGFIISKAL